MAAHVVGMTNIDDLGLEGLELSYDELLRGRPGLKTVLRNRRGETIKNLDYQRAPRFGTDVTLSLDMRLQFLAFRELKAAVAGHRARSGSLVMLDARTGEILALVNEPSFNPNDLRAAGREGMRNRAITDIYEPGSTIKPFTVLAAEIRRLAQTTTQSSSDVGENIARLERTAGTLIEVLKANIERGRDATRHIDSLSQSLTEMAALVHQFHDRSQAIAGCNTRAEAEVAKLDAGLTEFRDVAARSSKRARQAREQLEALESRANDMLNQVAHGGITTRNSDFIAMALANAGELTALIDRQLAEGQVGEGALFDTDYRARPDTDPVQYDNRFADFADRHIRPLLDRQTSQHKAIVGCCLIDMNGYLPTHITERSQGQIPGQVRRNQEFSRNRQIFMDGQTRRALDEEGEFFLYAYRQDLGEGRYRALRSVFVPLVFNGRKWGLYELGYLI